MPQLNPDQIQAIQQKIQSSPNMAQPIISQIVKAGYDIPNELQQYTPEGQNAAPDQGTKLVNNFVDFQASGNDDVGDTGKALLAGAANVIPSAINDLGGIVVHPIKTVENIGGLAKNLITNPVDSLKGMWGYFTNRYGSYDNILNSIANDPTGVAMDLSVLLDGGGALLDAAKVGTVGEEAARAAELAGETAPLSLGGKLKAAGAAVNPITAPFKMANKVIGGGTDVSAVEAAATRQGANTGVDINSALTAGQKGGSFSKVVEGAAAFLPGSAKIISRFQNAWSTLSDSMVNFGRNMQDAFSGAGETPETIIKTVGEKVKDVNESAYAVANNLFGKFRATNGDLPVDITKAFTPTSVENAAPVSVQGVLDNVLNNNSVAFTKGLRNLFKEFQGALSGEGGSTNPEDFAKEQISQAGVAPENITDDMVQQYMKENPDLVEGETGGATSGGAPDFKQLYNISDRISTEFNKFTGKDITAVSALRDAIHSTLGDALSTVDPKLGEAWGALKQQYGTAARALGDATYRQLTSVNVNPQNFLEKFFGRRGTQSTMDALKTTVGQDNFYDMGRAFLLNQVLPAFSESPEMDEATKVSSNVERFNSSQFLKNISKISDAKWQQILDPETYSRFKAFQSDAGDFETILKGGIKGAKAFSEGSRTTPIYQVLRYVAPIAEGMGSAITGGGLGMLAGGVTTVLSLLFGQMAFSKLVGSSFGQRILSGSLVGQKVIDTAAKIGGSSITAAAADVASNTNNANNQVKENGPQLSDQQSQAIQQQLQAHPEQKQEIVSQLVKAGYTLPDFLSNGQ